MRVQLTLIPVSKKAVLPVNYNYFLTSLIYKIIKNSSEDYSRFLHDEGYRPENSKKGFKLFTYSMLTSKKFKIGGENIVFLNSHIQWQISSPVDDFIQHLVTGVFSEGQEIKIRPGSNSSISLNSLNGLSGLNDLNHFLIERVETLPRPEFKGTMQFTCLSPITISKVAVLNGLNSLNGLSGLNGLNRLNRLNCHYLRPWEEGFSEAIKNNLMKKYKLVNGQDMEDSDFEIKIDTDYMNKKNGKITKNINFKGTNIIGFMAPFEVRGNPELIEIGYEAGFGEKGSMGFGMVKEIV
ncbi:MAG: CRISPR-associated endoribonuclease Cas6 [Nitrospirota bacterium]